MAHQIEFKREGDSAWRQVGGAVVHLYAFRYRVIVTDGIEELLETSVSPLDVRIDGIDAVEVQWASPEETAPRGYVSCEVTLQAPS